MSNKQHLCEDTLFAWSQRDEVQEPDFEAMWGRMQTSRNKGDSNPDSVTPRDSGRGWVYSLRPRLLPFAISAGCLLLSVPVVAGMTLGWPVFMDRIGITTAVEGGFGQRIDKTLSSGGVTVNLQGVVKDESRIDILFSMNARELPTYDMIRFGRSELVSESGRKVELSSLFPERDSDGEIRGLLEADYPMDSGKERYDLTLGDLSLYRYASSELGPAEELLREGQQAQTGQPAFPQLKMQSVHREGEMLSIQYSLPGALQDHLITNPMLQLVVGEKTIKAEYAAVAPGASNEVITQLNFRVGDRELREAAVQLNYLEAFHRVAGSWNTSFEADGRKAAEVSYRRNLDPGATVNDANKELKELIVTPMQIRVAFKSTWQGVPQGGTIVDYEGLDLMLGDELIRGSMRSYGENLYMVFETPEWYKDWSTVPMKLVLSGGILTKRAKWEDAVTLSSPSDAKQQVRAMLDGPQVTFTYYRSGGDLVVESQSDDPSFKGISQSCILTSDGVVYPDDDFDPPGGNGTNHRVERYTNLLNKNAGELRLSPGFYRLNDPDRRLEIKLQ
ncbi:hypothetical protein J2T17_007657 [Paenibacillus mucilaginosus]|uniref:hypothetical protein n=1 Tax=Paenibacillus mucilaginosus TaxID=61624 RepID=UPI003D1A4B12